MTSLIFPIFIVFVIKKKKVMKFPSYKCDIRVQSTAVNDSIQFI